MAAVTGSSANVETYQPLDVDSTIELPESRILYGPAAPTSTVGPLPDSSSASQVVRNLGPTGGGLQGRRGDRKGDLLGTGGGTPASENAVALGLAWLAAHQWQDGGWRLDLTAGTVQRPVRAIRAPSARRPARPGWPCCRFSVPGRRIWKVSIATSSMPACIT